MKTARRASAEPLKRPRCDGSRYFLRLRPDDFRFVVFFFAAGLRFAAFFFAAIVPSLFKCAKS